MNKYILKMMFHLMLIRLFVALYLSLPLFLTSLTLSLPFFLLCIPLSPSHSLFLFLFLPPSLARPRLYSLFLTTFFSLSLSVSPLCDANLHHNDLFSSSALIFTHRLCNKVSLECCNLRCQFFEQIFIENQAKLIVMMGCKLNRNGVFLFSNFVLASIQMLSCY